MTIPLSLPAASDLLAIERLVCDAQALLADALTVAIRLTGRLPDEMVQRVRHGLATAANMAGESTAPLAGVMAEAQATLSDEVAPF